MILGLRYELLVEYVGGCGIFVIEGSECVM